VLAHDTVEDSDLAELQEQQLVMQASRSWHTLIMHSDMIWGSMLASHFGAVTDVSAIERLAVHTPLAALVKGSTALGNLQIALRKCSNSKCSKYRMLYIKLELCSHFWQQELKELESRGCPSNVPSYDAQRSLLAALTFLKASTAVKSLAKLRRRAGTDANLPALVALCSCTSMRLAELSIGTLANLMSKGLNADSDSADFASRVEHASGTGKVFAQQLMCTDLGVVQESTRALPGMWCVGQAQPVQPAGMGQPRTGHTSSNGIWTLINYSSQGDAYRYAPDLQPASSWQ
jgi:hypothetical protein